MKRLLDAKFKMMKAIVKLYKANKARFDVLLAMVPTMTLFIAALDKIDLLIPLAEEDTKDTTKQRDALRIDLYASTVVVTKAVLAYADSIADLELYGNMNWTVGKLDKLTFDKLGPTCTEIHKKATALKRESEPFGLTQEKLDKMESDNTAWIDMESATRSKEVAIGESLEQIAKYITDNMNLLKKRLDPMVYTLSETDPELYGLWTSTRYVEDPQTTKTQLKVNVFDKETIEPLYGVDLELSGKGVVLRAKTNVEGAAEFPLPIKQGLYLFKAMMPGYKTFTIIEYRIFKGKINRLDVYLEKEA